MKLQRQGKTSATLVDIGENQVLYSYSTPVAAFVPGVGYLQTQQHYSVTTSRHINKWLGSKGLLYTGGITVPQSEIDRIANGGHNATK